VSPAPSVRDGVHLRVHLRERPMAGGLALLACDSSLCYVCIMWTRVNSRPATHVHPLRARGGLARRRRDASRCGSVSKVATV